MHYYQLKGMNPKKGSGLLGAFILGIPFAIGRSIPLLIVGTFTGLLKNIKGLHKFQGYIEKVGGVILLI